MKILLIADGRSPITKNWIRMLCGLDYEISLVSTFPCNPVEGADLAGVIPVGFSSFAGGQMVSEKVSGKRRLRKAVARFRSLFLKLRAILAPLTLGLYRIKYNRIAVKVQPDLIHALRIPFEGMLAAGTPDSIPLVVSIWGNDLTFHARTSPLMVARTRETLARADGLMADALRDIELAKNWGLQKGVPAQVVPGSGGLDLDQMRRVTDEDQGLDFPIPPDRPLVINPRGFRPGSVHQDIFFRSIPLVLKQIPDAFFVCTAMQDQPLAKKRVRELKIEEHVLLLPYLRQDELWKIFSRSRVYVSLSSHDGTPNTFLEALACGCFPVVGDIASLREWIEHGRNGLLVNPTDPQAAAEAIIHAIKNNKLRKAAIKMNEWLIKDRTDIRMIRRQVGDFYERLLKS